MKRCMIVLAILFLSAILGGCYDYKEVNHLSMVSGIAIDYSEILNEYSVVIQTLHFSGSATNTDASPLSVEGKGTTIYQAVDEAEKKIGKTLFISQANVIIIGENAAKNGIFPIIDWLLRNEDPSYYIYLLVASDEAGKILMQDKISDTITSLYIEQALLSFDSSSFYLPQRLFEVINVLEDKGQEVMLPAIFFEESEEKKATISISGSAAFKKDKLAAYINANDTFHLAFLLNKISAGTLVKKGVGEDKDAVISLNILSSSVKAQAKVINGKPFIEFSVSPSAMITQMNSSLDYERFPEKELLKKEVNKMLEEKISQAAKKVLNAYKTDVLGISKIVFKTNEPLFKKLGNDFSFMDIDISVKVNIDIRESANIKEKTAGE